VFRIVDIACTTPDLLPRSIPHHFARRSVLIYCGKYHRRYSVAISQLSAGYLCTSRKLGATGFETYLTPVTAAKIRTTQNIPAIADKIKRGSI
jgi:hypothetical protein